MSLSETQQIYQLLTEIDKLLADIEAKIQNIERQEPRLRENLITLRQLERVALRYAALAKRISGSEDADRLLRVLSRILIIMRMLEISGTMLFSGSPYGVLLGIAGLGMTQASILEGY